MYVFEVVEKGHTGYLTADSRDQMLQIGTWLAERANFTGLNAHIHQNDRFIPTCSTDYKEEDVEDFSEFLVEEFNEFRAALH